MSAFFTLGSLVLGVLSWCVPMIAVYLYMKGRRMKGFSIYSFTCCCAALLLQFLEIWHRVVIEDFTAIMDTIGAIFAGAFVLVVITVVLNIAAFRLYNTEQAGWL